MVEQSSFQTLVRRMRAGDQDAAAELVRVYEPQVRRAVRVRLTDPRLRQLIDSVDICQSVLGNFFVRAAAGQFDIDTPGQLLRLLVTMARNKLTDWTRKQHADRRDDRRERRLDAHHPSSWQPADPGPSPSEAIGDQELLQAVRGRLSVDERYLAEQRSHGRPWTDLATELGATPQAVRMKLTRALDRVARQLGL